MICVPIAIIHWTLCFYFCNKDVLATVLKSSRVHFACNIVIFVQLAESVFKILFPITF